MRAIVFALGLALASCASAPDIRTDFDASANFSKYRLYSWRDMTVPAGMNPLIFERLKAVIGRSLDARGFAESSRSNFTIAFTITSQKQTDFYDFQANLPRQLAWHAQVPDALWYPLYSDIYANQYYEQRYVIDIYDSALNRPVWHGVTIDNAAESPDDDVDYARVAAGIDALLARFPPTSMAR